MGRNGITAYDHSWRCENPHPDPVGTHARILGNVKRLADCKAISDELCCICGISSYLNELPSFVDDFWAEINAVIEDLGIHNRLRRMQHPVGACCLRNETTEARMVSGTLVVAGPVTWRQALVQ